MATHTDISFFFTDGWMDGWIAMDAGALFVFVFFFVLIVTGVVVQVTRFFLLPACACAAVVFFS